MIHVDDGEKKSLLKQTSHTPMTALKRRCVKGLRHGRRDNDTSRQPPVFGEHLLFDVKYPYTTIKSLSQGCISVKKGDRREVWKRNIPSRNAFVQRCFERR